MAGEVVFYNEHVADAVADRMRLALELNDLGVRMYAQRLRREHPNADAATIDSLVTAWLSDRPADAPGESRLSGA